MSCLAVLFALNEQEVKKIKMVKRQERSDYLHEKIEEMFFEKYPEYTCELDKSWDAMHRMLTDGNLNFENKFPPLCNVIFGGEFLYGLVRKSSGKITRPKVEDDEFIILKTPEQVAEISKALLNRTKDECRKCYYMIDKEDYGFQTDEEDFEYTWTYLQSSLDFWKKAEEKKDMFFLQLTDNFRFIGLIEVRLIGQRRTSLKWKCVLVQILFKNEMTTKYGGTHKKDISSTKGRYVFFYILTYNIISKIYL